jgi:hypothetical protein
MLDGLILLGLIVFCAITYGLTVGCQNLMEK